jgi:hypothetical protein
VTAGRASEGTAAKPRSPSRWGAVATRRWVLLAALVAVLFVGGGVTWWALNHESHSTTIPASFDGTWVGKGGPYNSAFTATLAKDLHLGRVDSGASSCYGGVLTVSDATDSRLTMRFAPQTEPGKCNPWTVVFTHLSGGRLRMAVDSDHSFYPEQGFEVPMTRQD